MDYVQAGMSPSLIRDHFKLTIKQTADVLHYIETHQEEIKTEYQQVLKEAEEIRNYWEQRNRERFEAIKAQNPRAEQAHLYEKLRADKARLGMA
jgi:Tfp pilus assembly protein PilO